MDEKLQVLGRLLPRIHNIGAVREIKHRPTLTGETYGLKPLAFLKENGFLPAHLAERYSDAVHEIVTIFDTLSTEVPCLRYIRYAGWIARRWDDPAFPAAFPHFGTESYWEEETSDLEDQVEFIHKHRDDLPSHLQRPEVEKEETEGLTNKDYFYDLDD